MSYALEVTMFVEAQSKGNIFLLLFVYSRRKWRLTRVFDLGLVVADWAQEGSINRKYVNYHRDSPDHEWDTVDDIGYALGQAGICYHSPCLTLADADKVVREALKAPSCRQGPARAALSLIHAMGGVE
jgi:hypothetical protein